MSRHSPQQRVALEAMGLTVWRLAPAFRQGREPRLGDGELPRGLVAALDLRAGADWRDWPLPEGDPGEARFKRALWRRLRDRRLPG